MKTPIPVRGLLLTWLIVSIWINASEVLRYFVFVMPMTRQTLAMVPDVAPMNNFVFASWGAWDELLAAMVVWFSWLHLQRFTNGRWSWIAAGTMSWLMVFVLFWLAMINMGLARIGTPLVALPLAWLELVLASGIAALCFRRLHGLGNQASI